MPGLFIITCKYVYYFKSESAEKNAFARAKISSDGRHYQASSMIGASNENEVLPFPG